MPMKPSFWSRVRGAFAADPAIASLLTLVAIAAVAATVALARSTWDLRFRRDVNRGVVTRNWALLDSLTHDAGAHDSTVVTAAPDAPPDSTPYIVVSLADRRMWYKEGNQTLYTTRVAVGSGKTLVKRNGRDEYRFDTPRGRLVVQSKDADPMWVPPEWHYEELARQKKLKLVMLQRGDSIPTPDSGAITVVGNNVAKVLHDGTVVPFEASEGHEIIVGKQLIVPPFGTNQRRYRGVLGSHRLNLGDGYALHGTDDPASVGHAVSHGCIRLRNEDIDYLYGIVPVGTPVFVY